MSPEFEFESGLIYVDAFVSNLPGSSFVNIAESNFIFNRYQNEFIENARVVLKNIETGTEVVFVEEDESYLPENDFSVQTGESWELDILLPDGRQYKSLPETIDAGSIPISEIKTTYDPEFMFSVSEDDFVPGHSISFTFDDPPQEDNFYFWRYRSFEELITCEICEGGLFRDGECISYGAYIAEFGPCIDETVVKPFNTYTCSTDCWKIRFNENIKIFSDEFSNGNKINNLPVADILLFTKNDILVEIQQYSISAEGYRYFKILKDIVDNNGNFNATPPAALLGNMFNPNNGEEYVLGRFTAAFASTASVFIDRTNILEKSLEETLIDTENAELFFGNGLKVISTTPCVESQFRTGTRPEGWID
ncbi:DUF4249 domain-containing protein [Croceitalea rosinachiae]|uniref:DUF4249 domain-containing protein n=1 Tax=Croceitalea rosinachiae TaxID=3075596 RepID=A0ABU3A6A5_9FLAO|nr:DUF4249 domain-containing protein [Croceitalea sp. F388]MDT0605706.1 DUF4249 domain-containing protein [Croceitalea sp. F388]